MRIDTAQSSFDMQEIQNRRFMFNPQTGTLILGRQYSGNQIVSSHAEEHGRMDAGEPFDDFVRGWIGTGRSYTNGVIHFAPPIPKEHPEIFDKGYSTLEMFAQNGTDSNTVIRGFPGAWEQPLSSIIDNEMLNELRKERKDMNEPLSIQLTTRELYEAGSGGAWLKLPAAAEQLNAALARIGAANGEKDFFINGFESPVAAVARIPLENVQKAGLDKLNFLAAALQSRDDRQIEKLNAAAEIMADPNDIHGLAELTQNTGVYDFHPDIFNHIQLGKHTLEHSGLIQIPDEWTAAIDVEVLGRLAAEHEKGHFSEHGYIVPNGEEWKPVNEIPQEYRISSPERDYDTIATRAPAVAVAAAPFVLVADNPRDRMKEITDKLEAGIKDIFESEQYKTYLKTLSKFHNYSFNNCLLIAMQKPDASHVAGFTAWREDFKRQVRKGEKGIKILAPAPFKTKREVDKLDANGKPIISRDGKRVKEEKEITVPAFKVTTVFDVSQTDGEPLPQIGVNELTGSVDRYKDFFAALEKTSRVPIGFEKIASGAKGYYEQKDKRIAINKGMSELQNLKTLIHEIAHSRLHDIDKNAPKDTPRPDRRTREVEAESIAYTVCQHYGLDTSDYSFAYVATWSGDKQLDALKSSLDTIRKEADAIISEVDKHFAELTRSKEQTAEKPAPEHAAPANGDASEQGDTFTIYQLKDGNETRDLRFEPLARLKEAPNAANYDKVYAAPLAEGVTLEKIYFTFNMDRPEDFKGHSLSISDVVVLNRDGKETAFYVDGGGKGFQELPGFLPPKEPTRETPAPAIDLTVVADYMQKQYMAVQAADPNKTQGQAAFNMAVKRLEQANGRIPDNQSQLKALITHAAQSPDLAALKERMNTLHSEFIQHYATAVQMTIDTSSKAQPSAPAVSSQQREPAPEKPSIREEIAAGKKQLAGQKSAPSRTAAKTKTAGLGE